MIDRIGKMRLLWLFGVGDDAFLRSDELFYLLANGWDLRLGDLGVNMVPQLVIPAFYDVHTIRWLVLRSFLVLSSFNEGGTRRRGFRTLSARLLLPRDGSRMLLKCQR